jgi:NADH:ubiquinone oxidoreductase subunit K
LPALVALNSEWLSWKQSHSTMDNMSPETLAIFAIVVAAGSEIITLLPIKENSWVQLVIKALKVIFPKK